MSTEGTVRRLHLSGLHPSISHKELETRLSMFGTVDAVFPSETSKLCANGASKTYAIVHLDATDSQYKKLMGSLNGIMWKGSKLKIATAKPSYLQRMAEERERPDESKKSKKRKRRKRLRGTDGFQGRNWELVNEQNVHKHSGWIEDSLVFPLLTKPDRPVHLPVQKATAWTRKRARDTATPRQAEPVQRSRKIRIVMSRYGSRKIVFPQDDDQPSAGKAEGDWSFEDGEWIYKVRNEVRMREPVHLSSRTAAYTDNFSSMLDRLEVPECSKYGQALPPKEASRTERRRSASPPPFVPTTRQVLFNDEDSHMIEYASLSNDEQAKRIQDEREKMKQIALSLLGSSTDVMRLRGGARLEQDSSEDSSTDSDSDDSSDDDSDDVPQERQGTADEKDASKSNVEMSTLKDMFKPQEATSFSLMGGLDVEMDEEEEVVAPIEPTQPAPDRQQREAAFRPPPPLKQARAWAGTPASARFFELTPEQRTMADQFCRQDSTDEIERKHEEMREKLRGLARKRHRDAKKRVAKS